MNDEKTLEHAQDAMNEWRDPDYHQLCPICDGCGLFNSEPCPECDGEGWQEI